jgi:hypothetical protein
METWKQIPGFEGYYEVSDRGQVRTAAGRVLKPINVRGYRMVHLHADGARSDRYVHRLVLAAFVGPADTLHGLHRNGDPADNRLENLYYGTVKDNMADRTRHGNCAASKWTGEAHPRAVITEDDARAVKAWPYRKPGIYKAFPHIKAPTIDAIRCGRQWKHVRL